jgi:hypothetical protein
LAASCGILHLTTFRKHARYFSESFVDRSGSIHSKCCILEAVTRFSQNVQTEPPASPLRSLSGDDLSESESGLAGVILVESRRTKSDGDVALDLAAGDLDDGRDNEDNGPRTSKRRRQLKSSSESYMRWYDREAKEQEAEKRKEMVEFELGGLTKGNKRERRKMQNRLAQRAFRARSKIQNREVGPHRLGSDQGRGPTKDEIKEDVNNAVVKMNVDSDTQSAYLIGFRALRPVRPGLTRTISCRSRL